MALIGIQGENDVIKINPGPSYIMKLSDTCFYMSLAKEENSSLLIAQAAQVSIPDEDFSMSTTLTRRLSFRKKSFTKQATFQNQNEMKSYRLQSQSEMSDLNAKINAEKVALAISDTSLSSEAADVSIASVDEGDYIQGLPQNSPYVGCSPTICHLLRKKPELCCLRLNKTCDHSKPTEISECSKNKIIILAAQSTNLAIYNFIVPLRSYAINKNNLNPILLLLENE